VKTLPFFDAAFSEPLTVNGQLENALGAIAKRCQRTARAEGQFGGCAAQIAQALRCSNVSTVQVLYASSCHKL
jgi:urease alpha subunit